MGIAKVEVGAILLALFWAVIAHAQNVGIGVSNPLSKLSVNGTTSNGGLAIGDSTYTSTAGTVAPANGALIEGNVGIGLTTPQVPLHVHGTILVARGGVTGNFWNGTANTDGTELDLFGLIGVQRAAGADLCLSKPPSYTNTWLIQFLLNNTTIGTVSVGNGGTSVVYGTTSDVRLKENIRPTAKGLNEVMKIQVSDFNFKSKPGTAETGFIAQQLYTVLPEAVTQGGTDPSKDPWTVDYGRVAPLLTKAIQEQQGEISALKAENGGLQEDAEKLRAVEAEHKAEIDEQRARIAKQATEIAALKAANEKLTAMAADMEALKKAMTSIQEKENGGVRRAALRQ
jgi:hypothetical protein